MEREEMIKVLMEKTNIGREEAEKALEECNWDLLDSIIYVERKHKDASDNARIIIEPKGCGEKEKGKGEEDKFSGIGTILGRIFRFAGRIIKKGNNIFFEIRKENEKPVRIPLTISIILLICFAIPVLILLTAGLFFGYKYSLSGHNAKYDKVNDIFEEASKSADNIKNDFKEGYEGGR